METELGLPRPEQWQAFLSFRGGVAGLPKVFSQYCFLPIAASAGPRGSRFSGFRFARSALLSCLRSQAACAQSVGNEYCLPTPVSGIDGEPRCGLCYRILPQFAKVVAHGSYQGGLRELIYLLKYGGIERSSIVLGRTAAEAIDIPLRGCWQAARN